MLALRAISESVLERELFTGVEVSATDCFRARLMNVGRFTKVAERLGGRLAEALRRGGVDAGADSGWRASNAERDAAAGLRSLYTLKTGAGSGLSGAGLRGCALLRAREVSNAGRRSTWRIARV
jgi:hypothetical protein